MPASELSPAAEHSLPPPARVGSKTAGSDGCIVSSTNQLLLELRESPRWALSEEFNQVGSPSSSGATQASWEEHQAGSQHVQKGKVVLPPVNWSFAEHWSMRIYNLSQLLLLGFS